MNLSVNNNTAPVTNRNTTVEGSAATTPSKVSVIDPAGVQAYSAEEQTLFDELSSGMPPPGYPPARSSPDLKVVLDELEELLKSSGDENDPSGMASFDVLMGKMKLMMLKNRESELSLRDQMRLQAYDLKLQAVKDDLKAAKAAFTAAIIKGSMEITAGAINMVGGVKQVNIANKGLANSDLNSNLLGNLAQGTGMKYSGAAGAISGSSGMAAAIPEKKASDTRAEAEKKRAMAESATQLMNQANDRFALMREIMLDMINTQKSASEAITQAFNKRFSV